MSSGEKTNHMIPPIIPPDHPDGPIAQRTLVLCFDGTGDQFDSDNSNVVKFFNLLQRNDRRRQMVYYQPGIGTYASPQLVTSVGQAISKTLDKMIAWNLDAHVISGYEFLMQNYEEGNKICLFGFSRGAYIARALAGMLHKVGLLPPDNHQQVPFAYKMYKRTDEQAWHQSKDFKAHFSFDVSIDFIGVWDTVCSVGLIHRGLPFTGTMSNTAIRVFRHALSLDERRAKFKVNHFKVRRNSLAVTQTSELSATAGTMPGTLQNSMHKTDVKEVWFAGCHGDVGGGSVKNHEEHSLARIPLRWMIREVFRAKTGIRFYSEHLEDIGLNPRSLWSPPDNPNPEVLSIDACIRFCYKLLESVGLWSPAPLVPAAPVEEQKEQPEAKEQEAENQDIQCPIYDQLSRKKWWWILEVIPNKQHEKEKWWKDISLNLGRGRMVPPEEPFYVHRSVMVRQQTDELWGGPYRPRAKWGKRVPIYVD